jgi:hypothetical protein
MAEPAEGGKAMARPTKFLKVFGVTCLVVLFGWFGIPGTALSGPIIYNTVGQLGVDYPDLREINTDGTNDHLLSSPFAQSTTKLSNVLWGAGRPSWSRDGKRIAAYGIVGGNMSEEALAIFDPAVTQVVVPMRPNTIYTMFTAFSPDGSKLAYSNVAAANYVEFGILDLNSGTPQKVLEAGVPVTFLWSPQVTVLGYADNTSGLSGFGIDWSPIPNLNVLVVSYADPNYPQPCPSAFSAADAVANGLLGMPLDWNTNPSAPAFSTRLYLIHAASGGLYRALPLTNPPVESTCLGQVYGDFFPGFSNDGSHIAFVRISQAEGTSTILVIPAGGCGVVATGCPKAVASGHGLITRVSWSPDDSQLLFDFGNALWKADLKAGGITQFKGPAVGAYDAAWSPVP